MSGGTHYTFRIKDAEIEQVLAAMPERSDFIRQAIFEKLRASGDVRSGMPSEPSVLAIDPSVDPASPTNPVQADETETDRLRAGLNAIVHSTTAILDAGGEDVPELVRIGLIGISETAAILAAEGQGGAEKSDPPAVGGVPDPANATASRNSRLSVSAAQHTAPRPPATSDQKDPQ